MKSKINTLLPIALAATLPGLSLFANPELEAIDTFYFLGSWLRISVLLYFLWFLLAQIWKLKPVYRPLAYGLIIGLIELSVLFLFADLIFVERIWFSVFRVILASVLFLAIQFALRAQQNIAQLMLDKEQIQTENYRVQLNALRTQIDPHFLFNSLNTLRSMVRQGHHNSENFVMSLADFYRKTLKHNEHPTLPLAEELLVLESYVFLMKSRNEKAVIVNIAIDEQIEKQAFTCPGIANCGRKLFQAQ
ncbi:MAG: histidine kinase [Bacteroidia bacterium]|nr:histidine kinase [Bacteroidia bacterium]